MSNDVYVTCARVALWKVVLNRLELDVGLPHQTLKASSPMVLYNFYTALQVIICLRTKGSYHRMMSLTGQEMICCT